MSSRPRTTSLYVLLGSSALLYLCGILAPLMSVTKFFIFTNTVSLLTVVRQLFAEGYYVLGIVVGTFAGLVPIGKLIVASIACWRLSRTSASLQRLVHQLALWGKWSMLDVFLVALLVVVVKVPGMMMVKVHYGLYAFAASILLLHIATCRLTGMMTESGFAAESPAVESECISHGAES